MGKGSTADEGFLYYDVEAKSSRNDTLGWRVQAAKLGEYLVHEAPTPLTVGIEGDWGSGKTSFLYMIEESFSMSNANPNAKNKAEKEEKSKQDARRSKGGKDKDVQEESGEDLSNQLRFYLVPSRDKTDEIRVFVMRFNSWVFDQSKYSVDELFPIYIAKVIEAYLGFGEAEKNLLSKALDRMVRAGRAGLPELAKLLPGAGGAAAEAVRGLIAEESPSEVIEELPGSKQAVQKLVDKLLDSNYSNRLIIVVDDLDRIAATDAIKVMEKLKVFFDVEGVIFLLAADLKVLEEGLRHSFGYGLESTEGKNYLDKIVKLRYNVPQLSNDDLAAIMLKYHNFNRTALRGATTIDKVKPLFSYSLMRAFPSIGGNIRTTKLVLLNFEFSYYLAPTPPDDYGAATRLLAVIILYQHDPELAQFFHNQLTDALVRNTNLPRTFEQTAWEKLLLQKDGTRRPDIMYVSRFFDVALQGLGEASMWLDTYHYASSALGGVG